jgi:hypothetical protein
MRCALGNGMRVLGHIGVEKLRRTTVSVLLVFWARPPNEGDGPNCFATDISAETLHCSESAHCSGTRKHRYEECLKPTASMGLKGSSCTCQTLTDLTVSASPYKLNLKITYTRPSIMSVRTPYRETRRKLLMAFDVGTTFSGVSYRCDVT